MTIAARRTLTGSLLVAALVMQPLVPIDVHAAEAPTATPSTTAAPPSTPAPAPLGPDEVLLQGGGFVRGTVVEVVPDVKVVIVVDGTGERREIPMDQVVEVQRGKHAAPVTPEPKWTEQVEPDPEPAEATPTRGKPRVHIVPTRQTSRPVRLFEINSEIVASGYNASMYGINFSTVCTAPCGKVVDGTRGQDFFLGMSDTGIWTASRKFSLDDKEGDVTLRVKPGNRGLRVAGAILLGLGIGLTIGGAVFMIPTRSNTLQKPGIVMLAVGIPSFAAGLPMMLLGRTRYEWADRDTSEDP
jgi:hypothetical protein